jgi:chromosome segregation ATPase
MLDREAAAAREEADGHKKEFQDLKGSLMKLNADIEVLRGQLYVHASENQELKGRERSHEEREKKLHEEAEGLRGQIKGHVEEIVELRELSKLSKAELEKATGLLKRFEEAERALLAEGAKLEAERAKLEAERAKSSAASGEAGEADGGLGALNSANELEALRRDLSRTQVDIQQVGLLNP